MSSPFFSLFALQWGELPDSYGTDFGYSHFAHLQISQVLKRGYVTHAKDGTDLRATLHSCEMWFRFKKKATTKQCLLLESTRDVIILEYYCMESTVGVHWRNVGVKDTWNETLRVIYTQLVSFSFMQVLFIILWFGHITASFFLCAQSCS